MLIELTKKELTAMVKGSTPDYEAMEHNPLVKKCGYFVGGHSDTWHWNYGFEDNLTEEQLWYLYVVCRDGWEK